MCMLGSTALRIVNLTVSLAATSAWLPWIQLTESVSVHLSRRRMNHRRPNHHVATSAIMYSVPTDHHSVPGISAAQMAQHAHLQMMISQDVPKGRPRIAHTPRRLGARLVPVSNQTVASKPEDIHPRLQQSGALIQLLMCAMTVLLALCRNHQFAGSKLLARFLLAISLATIRKLMNASRTKSWIAPEITCVPPVRLCAMALACRKIQECAVAVHGTELKRTNSAAKAAVRVVGANVGLAMRISSV